ncbi:unnamed protein product [Nezara viridula]|uniref:Uncharacterized protein n=1 Tax=Nezara viridula TaxID=85310 RepID=A0A9P0MRU7_NEZVI|nr:unnamed protein product [Nezara viridula]
MKKKEVKSQVHSVEVNVDQGDDTGAGFRFQFIVLYFVIINQ